MAKRKKKEHDFAVTAFRVVQEATGQIEEEPKTKQEIDYSALGRKGGLKGGKARAARLTPEQRSEIGRKAARARWSKKYFSLGLVSLGFQRGDKIAIIGDNNPQWFWAELGAMAAGGVATGVFVDCSPPEVKYQLDHSDSTIVESE